MKNESLPSWIGLLCLCTLTAVSCQSRIDEPPKAIPPREEALLPESDIGMLDFETREWSTGFRKGTPQRVMPSKNGGVSADIKGGKVYFTLTGDVPESDATLNFVIDGAGNQKAFIVIKVTGRAGEEELEPKNATLQMTLTSGGSGVAVFEFTRGTIERVAIVPRTEGFTTEHVGKLIRVVARDGKPGRFDVAVTGTGKKARNEATIHVEARNELGLKRIEVIDFKGLKGGRIEARIPGKGSPPVKLEVKIFAGRPEHANVDARGMTAELSPDRQAVVVAVTSDAVAGSYQVWVSGKDGEGKRDSKEKFTVVLTSSK